ncbi:F-box domain-containing protein [Mycena chlorophos]|uniref:F-box domain-containing protein n=1 Tax=Mycena chlorophos TaxID=658473 RepID=A0A8H6VQ63_MYCCL|nr:F-box domain-containing protein [Mycena chlorophos]
MDRAQCSAPCTIHCPSYHPQRFYFCEERILHSNEAPTDHQRRDVQRSIGDAYQELNSIQNELFELQCAITRIQSREIALHNFIFDHSPVIAPIRRIPNEILCEIFSHCVQSGTHMNAPNPSGMALTLTLVCRKWRRVALSYPLLWRKLRLQCTPQTCLPGFCFCEPRSWLHLDRSAAAPLQIAIDAYSSATGKRLLDVLLSHSYRWADVSLNVTVDLYRELFMNRITAEIDLPILKRLSLRFMYPNNLEHPTPFLRSLTALEDLTLDMAGSRISSALLPVWSQLRHCALRTCQLEDILRVLPLLRGDASLSLTSCQTTAGPRPIVRTTLISSLSFAACDEVFVTTILQAITAPRLTKIRALDFLNTGKLVELLLPLLARSDSNLTHLCLDLPYTTLAISDLFPAARLAAYEIAPRSRAALHGDHVDAVHGGTVPPSECCAAASRVGVPRRKGVLKELWLMEALNVPVVSEPTRQVLSAAGVEVVYFHADAY